MSAEVMKRLKVLLFNFLAYRPLPHSRLTTLMAAPELAELGA